MSGEKSQKYQPSKFLLGLILTMGAFGVMGGGLVAPGIPTIGAAFSAPEEQLGLILSVYTISAAVSLPVIGYFIDTLGRRKVALLCLTLDGIAGLGSTLASSFAVLLGWRFLQGIGVAGLIPVAMTIISDCFQDENRLRVMGMLTATISIGAVIIPSLGGALASIDWRLVFSVYSFSLILALAFFFKLPETSASRKNLELRELSNHIRSLLSTLKLKDIRVILLQAFATYFFLYAMVTFLPVFIYLYHGMGEVISGISLSIQGLIGAVFATRANFFAKYLNWQQRTGLGFVLLALSLILLPFWPQESYLIFLSMVIYGSGMGIINPTIYNRVTNLPPEELSGTVISLFNTFKYIGMSASPLVLGLLLIYTSLPTLFVISGIAAAAWAGSVLLL